MNLNMDKSNYNLVCKYCENDVRFAKFDQFLEHARSTHGPSIGVSAIAIVVEDEPECHTKTKSLVNLSQEQESPVTSKNVDTSSARPDCDCEVNLLSCTKKISVISIDFNPAEPATSTICSRVQTPFTIRSAVSSTSNNSKGQPFDLSNLPRPCLLDVVRLLGKCVCIWHKPSRKSMTRKDRFNAYQLLLRKLRQTQPEAKFRDIRNIVRQLITNFFNEINGECGEDDIECDEVREIDKQKGKNKWPGNDTEKDHSESDLNPIKSKTVFENLMFLTQAEKPNLKEVDLGKLCSFCNMSFYAPESLFQHMLNNHLLERQGKEQAKHDPLAFASGAGDAFTALDMARTRRNKSSGSTRTNSEHETDYCTDHSGFSDCNHRSVKRRRRRKSKSSYLRMREPKAKRSRRSQDRDGCSGADTDISRADTEISVGDSKSSRYFLNDYSDQFLNEFIDLYHQHECLWSKNPEISRNRKLKTMAYDALAAQYRQSRNVPAVTLTKIKYLIRRLRNYYNRLNKPNANQYRRHIWQRMAFISEERERTKSSATISTTASRDGVLDCQECSKRFKRSANLSSHILRMHPPTYCNQCSQKFASADELKKHLLQQHAKCNECPLCHSSKKDWKTPQHMSEHFYDHICPSCSQIFHDGLKFQQHKHSCCSKDRFHCSHCGEVFTGTHEYRRHAKQEHQDTQPFKCDICAKRYKFLTALIRHQSYHKQAEYVDT